MSKERKRARPGKSEPVTLETVRRLALALRGAEEGTSYNTPAFKVGGTLFARLHQDGESLVVKIDPDERRMRMNADPETYFITEHYRDYPMMLVRLASVAVDDLRDLLEQSWRRSAPRKLLSGDPGDASSGR
jgi:hypothetical protein